MLQVNSGIQAEFVADGKIIVYTLTSAKLATLTAWSELALRQLKAWPVDQPYLALHDLSYPGAGLVYLAAVEYDVFNIGVTPGRRKEVDALLEQSPNRLVGLAIVISASLTGGIMQLKLLRPDPQHQRIRAKAFFDRAAAVEWLAQLGQSSAE
jgi:hypothetical protein